MAFNGDWRVMESAKAHWDQHRAEQKELHRRRDEYEKKAKLTTMPTYFRFEDGKFLPYCKEERSQEIREMARRRRECLSLGKFGSESEGEKNAVYIPAFRRYG